MNLSNFQLLKEDSDAYHVGHPSGRKMVVPKKGLSDKAHEVIAKMKPQHFAYGGGPDGPDLNQVEAPVNPAAMPPQDTPAPQAVDPNAAVMPPASAAGAAMGTADSNPDRNPDSLKSGVDQERAGIQNEANTVSKQGTDTEKAINDYQNQVSDLPTQNQIVENNKAQDDALRQSFADSSVDPNRYWHDKSTGSKVLAGVGLLFSGMGSALAGQPNYAMENINKAIERDIDAQKNDQSKAMNLWKMNHENLGTNLAANLATRNQYDVALQHQIMKVGAQNMGPMAQAKAQQAIGQIQTQIDQRNAVLGLHAALTGNAQPGTEQEFLQNKTAAGVIDPSLAKDVESKYIPGVGVAKTAVGKEDADALMHYNQIEKLVNQAKTFADTQGPTMVGTQANRQANDLQSALQLEVNKLVGLNRINEFEGKRFSDMVGNPGAWRSSAAKQSFNDLAQLAKTNRAAEMSKLGVVPFSKNPNQPQAGAQPSSQYQPGQVVSIRGRGNFVVGPDGNSLRPLQ